MIELRSTGINFDIEIDLPASKSIHNRVLILDRLYDLGLTIKNPSDSGDTKLLETLLNSEENTLNCENAGTVLRFLTAYFSVKNTDVTITGSSRMLERPVDDLVNALNQLGANIHYIEKTGFPPILIHDGMQKGGKVMTRGNKSSQFISALCMIGPYLENGLEILIEGEISSRPYIEMTIKLMQYLGFDIHFEDNKIKAEHWNKVVAITEIEIEPDWSAVGFWFQIIALSKNSKIFLKRLKSTSIQGDSILINWAGMLGLKLSEQPGGILIERSNEQIINNSNWDLKNYPDLAPSIIVLLSASKRRATFKGLESLKIKESDRTLALQTELKKCGVKLEQDKDEWVLDATGFELKEGTIFENYNDHRIAMALATLAFIKPIKMENPETVGKSYPGFWKDLQFGNLEIWKFGNSNLEI